MVYDNDELERRHSEEMARVRLEERLRGEAKANANLERVRQEEQNVADVKIAEAIAEMLKAHHAD